MQIAKITKFANVFDWALGAACLGYGLYSGNLWWVAGGVLSLCVAAINPTKRVTGLLQGKLQAKSAAPR